MRAIQVAEFGPPEVLVPVELPDPAAGPGRVVVAVERCGVTFADTMTRAGRGPGGAVQPPYVPGNGVGGTVAGTGPGVDPGLLGRRVVSTTGGSGGYAERVSVPAGGLVPVPDGLDLDPAVAMLTDGRTALGLFARAGVRPGETVLVEAAAGGVGTLLVQLALAAGATVVAAAGRAKLGVPRDLGAQVAIDYTAPDWARQVRAATGGRGVDAAFESVGGAIGAAALDLVAPGGRLVQFGLASGRPLGTDPADLAARAVRLIGFAELRSIGAPATALELATRALAAAAAGRLRPIVGQRFPLAEAAAAHRAVEDRVTVGKSLLMT
ncbi:zinc-binding dehydrogenase [Rhizomonospora bruguierae]|uniref:zinc-binding dehydrogenase n=1 Tax=Rhizomonospora bruguierae TaxID=1581705 RepID=UPI001BD19885|nr:zinc-binding dehydrogenase [Micromonospora sp. NBRC 107566]